MISYVHIAGGCGRLTDCLDWRLMAEIYSHLHGRPRPVFNSHPRRIQGLDSLPRLSPRAPIAVQRIRSIRSYHDPDLDRRLPC